MISIALAVILSVLAFALSDPAQVIGAGVCVLLVMACIQMGCLLQLGTTGPVLLAIVQALVCAMCVALDSWACGCTTLLFIPVATVCLFMSYLYFKKVSSADKGAAGSELKGQALAGMLCSSMLFFYMLAEAARGDQKFFSWALVALAAWSYVIAMASTWGYVRLASASDLHLFDTVLACDDDLAPNSGNDVFTSTVRTAEEYLLHAIICPAVAITRMREHVVPDTGLFHVVSEIEYDVPPSIRSVEKLYLPVVFQGKQELTRGLKVSMPRGFGIPRRLNDDELVKVLAEALDKVSKWNSWELKDIAVYENLIRNAFLDKCDESDADYNKRVQSLFEELGDVKDEQLGFLSYFFSTVRFVKPICYELTCASRGAIRHVSISVERSAPLVPVRRMPEKWLVGLRTKTRRLFSKRRMYYYYGLGGADCAQSYHLSFSGLPNTYLTTLHIEQIGEPGEFFICRDMSVSARYDQQHARLYVREGRGFSRSALAIAYEMRNHRPIAVVAIAALACLLVIAHLFFGDVMSGEMGNPERMAHLFEPLSILSIGTLVSTWQAMEEYRAEEWLWLCIASTAAISLCAVIGFLCYELLSPYTEVWYFGWIICLTAQFAVVEFSVLSFFEKVKMHGALMDRVPHALRASSVGFSGNRKNNFARFMRKQEKLVGPDGDEREGDTSVASRPRLSRRFANWMADGSIVKKHGALKMTRENRYKRDIRAYRHLMSVRWRDGWLMPVWSSTMNPYNLPSRVFYDFAESVLMGKDAGEGGSNEETIEEANEPGVQ